MTKKMMMKVLQMTFTICMIAVIGCSKDENKETPIILESSQSITLNGEASFQIRATSSKPIRYYSDNEFNATVTDNGLITAAYVGETKIHLDNGDCVESISVVVEPEHNIYPTPCIAFGTSKQEIISMYGTDYTSESNAIAYEGNYAGPAPIVMYTFDSFNKLKNSTVMVKSTYTQRLADYLLERYRPVAIDYGSYTAAFINANTISESTVVVLSKRYNTSYNMVMYADPKDVN